MCILTIRGRQVGVGYELVSPAGAHDGAGGFAFRTLPGFWFKSEDFAGGRYDGMLAERREVVETS